MYAEFDGRYLTLKNTYYLDYSKIASKLEKVVNLRKCNLKIEENLREWKFPNYFSYELLLHVVKEYKFLLQISSKNTLELKGIQFSLYDDRRLLFEYNGKEQYIKLFVTENYRTFPFEILRILEHQNLHPVLLIKTVSAKFETIEKFLQELYLDFYACYR